MPHRRAVLAGASLLGLGVAGLVGRNAVYPVHLDYGVGQLHPASDDYLAPDARLDDHGALRSTVVDDGASLVGPDATGPVKRALSTPADGVLAVSQLRSMPNDPRGLRVTDVSSSVFG